MSVSVSELCLKNSKSCLSCLCPGCLWARVPVWAASKNWKCESCGWLLSWWEKIDRIWWTGRRAKFSILFTEAHPLQLALWALHGKEDRYEKLAKSDPVSDLETNNMWLMKTESRKMDSGNLYYTVVTIRLTWVKRRKKCLTLTNHHGLGFIQIRVAYIRHMVVWDGRKA